MCWIPSKVLKHVQIWALVLTMGSIRPQVQITASPVNVDERAIGAAINASIDALKWRSGRAAYNLTHAPPGLDGALSQEQAASEARCRNSHAARRDFIRWTSEASAHAPTKQHRADVETIPAPPLLWAFPGSGAPWVRLVIEYTTGHLTGSVKADPIVAPLLPGEAHGCDRGVLLLHADAAATKLNRIETSPIKYVCNTKPSNLGAKFTRVVALVRNPYDTVWEAFLREAYRKHDLAPGGRRRRQGAQGAVHAPLGLLRKAFFDQLEFRERAQALAVEWAGFLAGAAVLEKKRPHDTLVVQLEQLFSVSAMGSSHATGQVIDRQVGVHLCEFKGHVRQ